MAVDLDELLASATRALDELGRVDLDELAAAGHEQAVLAYQQLRARLDAGEARFVARWDADGGWRPSGAKSPGAWLAWKQRVPIGVARQRVHHARIVRAFPAIEQAWATGEIDRTHVSAMLHVRTPRTEPAFKTDHKELLDSARTKGFAAFRRDCRRWEQRVDADGAEQAAADDRAGRALHLNQSFGGMWFGDLILDPISGEIVSTTLKLIEQELFDADWAAARERLGREPTVLELDRTPAQRRADAVVEMAVRARTAPVGGRRPAPLFTVVVGYETFAGPTIEMFNGMVVTPGTIAPWLIEADVERVVFDGPARVMEVGRKRRFFTGGLRRAIEVRDRTCYHPSCDEPVERPQVDHILEASKGGPTVQGNGRLACGFHNRWRNNHPDDPDDADPPP